ncbi:hypothetical protein ACFRCQ_16685 [Cytobacillus firmus]|uniref:hypothetical protein n=1 Tax=Cytobacillus firmus TaxID=1399 RepID=UPI0036CACE4C
MYKSKALYQILAFFCFSLCINPKAEATAIEAPEPYEEILKDIGYKSIEEALKECEAHFQQELKLPVRIPALTFTHHAGRFFEDKKYNANDSFEAKYISEKSPENHYKIDVRHVNDKLNFSKSEIENEYKLKDGQSALLLSNRTSKVLVFEKGKWQYMLGIDNRVSDKVTPEMLVEIADSINYTN